jgi:hypothetical protein
MGPSPNCGGASLLGLGDPDVRDKEPIQPNAGRLACCCRTPNRNRRQKDHAWSSHYSAPISCEHPVELEGTDGMWESVYRAKKEFEKRLVAEHGTGQTNGSVVALGNGSIGGARTEREVRR